MSFWSYFFLIDRGLQFSLQIYFYLLLVRIAYKQPSRINEVLAFIFSLSLFKGHFGIALQQILAINKWSWTFRPFNKLYTGFPSGSCLIVVSAFYGLYLCENSENKTSNLTKCIVAFLSFCLLFAKWWFGVHTLLQLTLSCIWSILAMNALHYGSLTFLNSSWI